MSLDARSLEVWEGFLPVWPPGVSRRHHAPLLCSADRKFLIDNLLVRIHSIILMIIGRPALRYMRLNSLFQAVWEGRCKAS
jgi:hypothetical protein